jgi:hypothetical protein
MVVRIAIILGLGILCLQHPASCAEAMQSLPSDNIKITWNQAQRSYKLHATSATLDQIANALARVTRCSVEVNKELSDRHYSLDLTSMPAEHIFAVIARRANARLTIVYRLKPLSPGERSGPGPVTFAERRLNPLIDRPTQLDEALKTLEVSVENPENIRGNIQLVALNRPLYSVLDRIAQQVNARWETVVQFEPRHYSDAESATYERMHAHFSDLVGLSSQERQEEILADIAAIERLPVSQQKEGISRISEDVRSLGTLLEEVPEEHREPVWEQVMMMASDYWTVLSHLKPDQQRQFESVFRALMDLQQRVQMMQ